MQGFKKCSKGHYYQENLAQCPYCVSTVSSINGENSTMISNETKTQVYGGINNTPIETGKTEIYGGTNNTPTVQDDKTDIINQNAVNDIKRTQYKSDRTVFGDEVEECLSNGSQNVKISNYRNIRKLVGWLVSYSFDKMGVDYKLYEGKNVIGRDIECNITINDKMMSGKHATILFRADKYRIKDEMSSHGTFVNSIDIEDEHFELHDGDNIRMGETIFKFRSSL